MTKFRPCIDLHAGQVKQIVGGTLSIERAADLRTNYVSKLPAAHYATLYRESGATGAHVIMLGPGNEEAARSALEAWPGGLQVGGGINEKNAADWIENGASHVDGVFSLDRLKAILDALGGDTSKLVIDLSCRRKDSTWFVAMNKWQTITEMEITKENIKLLEAHCAEFLIHAADNEGLQQGIDEALIAKLAEWCTIPVTYAGGARHLEDLERVKLLSNGKVDVTIGSALDIFGGSAVKYDECIAWNGRQ